MTTITASEINGRSALARWLTDVFAGPVRSSHVAAVGKLHAPGLETEIEGVQQALRGAPAAVALALENERVRLFVNAPGGIAAPPFASYWIEGRLQGETSAAIAQFLRRDGLDAAAGSADALSVGLEYVHFLLQHQRAARATDQPTLEADARLREAQFVGQFLATWIPTFAAKARAAARLPAWGPVLDLLEAFVATERHRGVA